MTEQEDRVEISYVPSEADESSEELSVDKEQKETQDNKKAASKKRSGVKQLQKELKEKDKLLEELTTEKDDLKDKYLRNVAEVDNFRKRVKKEKEDYQKYVLSEFLLELLVVYDNLERALKAKNHSPKGEPGAGSTGSADERSIVSGVEMIHKQFSDLLKKYKVKEIEALGQPFDPNVHQALSKEEKEGITEPVVIEVYQKGFLYNEKLLKPTLVKVAIPKEVEEEEKEEEEKEEEKEVSTVETETEE